MSLATMGRKSRTTNPRLRRQPCFVLNMTGRGNVIGASFNAGQCRGKRPFYGKCKMGGQVTCCAADRVTPENCKKGCGCRYKGLSQPAPQMGYGVYLNRRSRGASRPGGGKCCSTLADLSQNKLTWKQSPNNSAMDLIQHKKEATIACYHDLNNNSSLTGKCTDSGCGIGKDTFIELHKYKMTVGNVGEQYGYDAADQTPYGSLSTPTLFGYFISELDWINGELDLKIDGDLSKCDIKSLTLSDPTMNSSETYYANRSNFEDGTETARWEWSTGNTFFPSRVGKQIDVIIEVEKKKKGPACIHNGAGARGAYGNCCKCDCRWPITKPRLSYTRINHHWCGTTKKLPHSTAGDFITRKRAANMCPKFGLSGFKKPIRGNKK